MDCAWQEQLHKKVKDPLVAAEIYSMLCAVLQETEETKFKTYFDLMLERLSSLNTDFHNYFLKEWAGREKTWEYVYRKGLGINTNMVLEAFHGSFKYNYLKGKSNKRVDNCLVNLLKYVRDKSFTCFIKLTRGGTCNKTRTISDRHLKSLNLICNKNSAFFKEENFPKNIN